MLTRSSGNDKPRTTHIIKRDMEQKDHRLTRHSVDTYDGCRHLDHIIIALGRARLSVEGNEDGPDDLLGRYDAAACAHDAPPRSPN